MALTLYAMGVILIPVIFYYFGCWLREGYALAGVRAPAGWARLMALLCVTVFGAALGSAIACSLLIHRLGWLPGAAVFAALASLALVRRGGLCHRLFRAVYLE